ncbi:MAG: helix-turn-helix transcriptional regulator, partial [Opitutales bacterium]
GRAELVGEARQGRPLPVALACLECPRQSSSLYRSGRCGGRLMLRLESLLAFSGDSVAQVWRQRAEGCAILAEVLESPELRTPRPCRVNCCGAGQTQTIEAVARYLEANLDTHHTIAGLARRHFINECALKRGFREHFGATIFAYLRERRMERAADLLSAGERSVIEAANAVGYTNPSHFARAFREATGVNPGQLAGNRRREA